jgi:MATE family multidrug resistance protein
MNVQSDQTGLLSDYFSIRIWAAPATLFLYVAMGWFFGLQNAIYPMILTIFINIINIVSSWYLVQTLGMEARGVALGTVIAQYAGLLLAVGMILYRYRSYALSIRMQLLLQWSEIQSFLSINSDLFIRTIALTFAFGFFYSMSSASGTMVLAANVILLQLVNWMSYGIDGFAYASEALVGKYHGQKNSTQLDKAVKYSMIWGFGFAILYSLAYWIFGTPILRLFTDDTAVLAFVDTYMWWMILFPIVGFSCYIWDGIYIGLTASKRMRDAMILSLAAYLFTYYLPINLVDMDRLWLSLCVLLFFRGIIQTVWYLKRQAPLQ